MLLLGFLRNSVCIMTSDLYGYTHLFYWGVALPRAKKKPESMRLAEGNTYYEDEVEKISLEDTPQGYNHKPQSVNGTGLFAIPFTGKKMVGGLINLDTPYCRAIARGVMNGTIRGISVTHNRIYFWDDKNRLFDGKAAYELVLTEKPMRKDCTIHGFRLIKSGNKRYIFLWGVGVCIL